MNEVADDEGKTHFMKELDHSYAKLLTGTWEEKSQGKHEMVSLLKDSSFNHSKEFRNYFKQTLVQIVTHEDRKMRKIGFEIYQNYILSPCGQIFDREIQEVVYSHIEDEDLTVRHEVARVLGVMAQRYGVIVWDVFNDSLIHVIESNMVREDVDEEEVLKVKATTQRHDTEGWNALESSLRSLMEIISNLKSNYSSRFSFQFLDLTLKLTRHQNRFVREVAFLLLEKLFSNVLPKKIVLKAAFQVSQSLKRGLADEWGHVLYAASQATRAFMMELKAMAVREHFGDEEDVNLFDIDLETIANGPESSNAFYRCMKNLIPYMCFNRYLPQDGIRSYSIQSWKYLVQFNGPMIIQHFAKETISVYLVHTNSDMPFFCETGCLCIRELMNKLPGCVWTTCSNQIFHSLKTALNHENWSVRDRAALACGAFLHHVIDCDIDMLETLFSMLFERLSDECTSVRQSSAVSIPAILYNRVEFKEKIFERIRYKINSVLQEPDDPLLLQTAESEYGPKTKMAHDNDKKIHTFQETFSCEHCQNKSSKSLVKRTEHPWKVSHGYLLLLTQLASCIHDMKSDQHTQEPQHEAQVRLPLDQSDLVDIGSALQNFATISDRVKKNFYYYHELYSTVWQALPVFAKVLEQQVFIKIFDSFFNTIKRSLSSENHILSSSARNAIVDIFSENRINANFLNEEQLTFVQHVFESNSSSKAAAAAADDK